MIDKKLINNRLDNVEDFLNDIEFLNKTQNNLKKTYDIKRIISKISSGKANPIDIVNLSSSLKFSIISSYVYCSNFPLIDNSN